MPEPSKFSGALAKLKQPLPKTSMEPLAESKPAASRDAEPEVKRGRPPGKRSNPDYEPTTLLLRKQTKRLANRKLQDTNIPQDLSDLIEKLLSEWVES